MEDFEVTFHPISKRVSFSTPTTILQAAESIGLNIAGPCGGKGKCGKCKIKIVEFPRKMYIPPDSVSKSLLSDTEQKRGLRLACTTTVNEDIGVALPPWAYERSEPTEQNSSIMIHGWIDSYINQKYNLEPVIKCLKCSLSKPTLDDNISDMERLRKHLGKLMKIDPSCIELKNNIMRKITKELHENDWQVEVILAVLPNKTELLDIRSADENYPAGHFGVALDIGTSTIVGYLIDLESGEELGVATIVNPQIRIGADVISRIRYSMQSQENDAELSIMLRSAINELIVKLCSMNNIQQEAIFEIVSVGNSMMLHNFLGFHIAQLGSAPYIPVSNNAQYCDASELNLNIHTNGKVYTGPIIAGFLGADAVGMALITNMFTEDLDSESKPNIKLALDIGTNGELLLGNHKRLLACSAAAGPAFEGGNLRFGIRAVPGAVNKVEVKNKRIDYSTIGGRPAIGITGSGVVDGISDFLRDNVIGPEGNINQQNAKKWLKYQRKITTKHSTGPSPSCDLILPELCIVPKNLSALDTPITIAQADIREIQLAKAAIRTGLEILMYELNITIKDINEVCLAGAFGNYLNPKSALKIGLLPNLDLEKIKLIGNAAGSSAKILLRSKASREYANRIAKAVEYIDLATHPKFQDLFIKNMKF